MEKRSWILTVITQICLCFGLYLALNLGQPQQQLHSNNNHPLDLYFITVAATPSHHSRLLNLMEKVVKAYDPKLVLSIAADLHKDDPLLNNETTSFQSLTLPWYTTTPSKGKPVDFVKRIELPLGKSLDIIAMNTALLQDSSNMSTSHQLQHWLATTLQATESHWRIVIGSHQLDACKSSTEQLNIKRIYQPLHKIFCKYGVNAYLSRRVCADYALRDGIAYIGLPGPMGKGPYHILGNRRVALNESSEEGEDGVLLHRISSLEMETYFVTLSGEVTQKVALWQREGQAV